MSRPNARVTLTAADRQICQAALQHGSKSFALAAKLLPKELKSPVAALYAFCREADDAIDTASDARLALAHLHGRLDRIFSGVHLNWPVDRALSQTVLHYRLPRPLFDALLEGFAWDAAGRTYETLSDVIDYSARVASTVGVLMTLMMGRREPWVLARAAELGVAMQLTNIARDVGEDARMGRLYLPRTWLVPHGVCPLLLTSPEQAMDALDAGSQRAICAATARLLACAEPLYERAGGALGALPWPCRMAIHAASELYRDIGRSLARQGYNSLHTRAYVRLPRKIWLVGRAIVAQLWQRVRPKPVSQHTVLPELEFLVEAVHPTRTPRAASAARTS